MTTDADVRTRIHRVVQEYPGLHLRELARAAEVTEQLASYHVKAMLAAGEIEDLASGGYRRFYAAGGATAQADRDALGVLRNPATARIAVFLLEEGGANNPELCAALGIAKSTTSYHLKRLVAAGLVRDLGQGQGYRLAEPERVRRLLEDWKPHGGRTDRFIRTWEDLYRSRHPK